MRCIVALLALVIFLSVQNVCYSESDAFRQEAAKVMYANPKFLEYLNVFTFRHTRKSPYLTSANISNLQPWDDNITVIVDCYSGKIQLFSFEFKLCEIIKLSWAKDWLKSSSNIPLICPIPTGSYHLNELEIPPKNFPVALPAGDYTMGLHFSITKTKEKICQIRINLRFLSKNKKNG